MEELVLVSCECANAWNLSYFRPNGWLVILLHWFSHIKAQDTYLKFENFEVRCRRDFDPVGIEYINDEVILLVLRSFLRKMRRTHFVCVIRCFVESPAGKNKI